MLDRTSRANGYSRQRGAKPLGTDWHRRSGCAETLRYPANDPTRTVAVSPMRLSSYLLAICILVSPCLSETAFSATKRRPQCSDGKDNDRDGKKDYPRDKGCTSKKDNNEKNPPAVAAPKVNAALGTRRIFPANDPWNQDISASPVDPNSDALIASIGTDRGLHPDFGTTWEGRPIGFDYVVVRKGQKSVPVSFEYSDESDRGPYPIPLNAPIEGGPSSDGDRHIIVIDADAWKLFELFYAYRSGSGFRAGSGAIFNLTTNTSRPAGWTSADAAGLPIFPGLVRYEEVLRGEIPHAVRFTVSRSRRAYIAPATHFASSRTDPNLPPMGMRVRLKQSYDISGFRPHVQVILRALKKHGMILADNGSNWYISGAHDSRWNDDTLRELGDVTGGNFEVVQMGTVVTD